MFVNILHSIVNDDNEIYFYTKLEDNLTDKKDGVYLIHKTSSSHKWFLCEDVKDIDHFIKNKFTIFYDAEKSYSIKAIIFVCMGESIRLTEFDTWDKEKMNFTSELDTVINFTGTNRKRKVEPLKIPEIAKILTNYYCDRCEEDSMRFECSESRCHNNKKVRSVEENKLKSYCDLCDEDGMRFCCDNSGCKNYHAC